MAANINGNPEGREDLFALVGFIGSPTTVTHFKNIGDGTLVMGDSWDAGGAWTIAAGKLGGRPSVFVPGYTDSSINQTRNMQAIVADDSGQLNIVTGSLTAEKSYWIGAAPDGTLFAGNNAAIQVFDTAGSTPVAVALQALPSDMGVDTGLAVDVSGDGKAGIVAVGQDGFVTSAFLSLNNGNNFTSYPVMPNVPGARTQGVAAGQIFGGKGPGPDVIGVAVQTDGPPGANAVPYFLPIVDIVGWRKVRARLG